MADAAPTVTVLMAVHDGQDFVREAVESVLAQTLRDLELLIIDDASTDSTPEILASLTDPRVRILTNSVNLGLTRSLNIGLREARGEFIARLDHDDAAAPDRLGKQLAFLREHPDCVAVGCRLELRGEEEKSRLSLCCVDNLSIRWKLLFDTALPHPTLTMRASAVKAVGGYDEYFPCTMDYDLECRLARVGKLHNLPEPLVLYREHPGQMSAKRKNEQQYYKMQISCREMGQLLGTGPVPEHWQAYAETVFRKRLPPAKAFAEAMTFSLRLARGFRQTYDCADFVSRMVSQLFSAHAKATLPCLADANCRQAFLHSRAALRLIGSGLIKHPLREIAKAAVPTRFFRSTRGAGSKPQSTEEV
jgi:glycosyltransferase involved in cell wall biosynthesis